VSEVEILHKLFCQVFIPTEVAEEMQHPKAPEAVRKFMTAIPSWLTVRSPRHPVEFSTLDPGESAAISLALELNAPLMIDERDGREIARSQGLEVFGATGVLERAADIGLIKDLEAVYTKIRTLRFHIAENILIESLDRHKKK